MKDKTHGLWRDSGGLGITWYFAEGRLSIFMQDFSVSPVERRKLLKKLHSEGWYILSEKLLEFRSQGKAQDCVALAKASSYFLHEGLYTRFVDWRFIHQTQLIPPQHQQEGSG
ncbi:hypothetical protein NPIL_25461 [Nephila pilipes]|uniref:Uncharacterized protein n=1 Tax=Nephila pilipes TaxID=299642 RepID=A0A8X6QZE2_NEPPI|nr:hypothetical protein NPIL_25461 [Nephila pilipes]